MKIGIFCPGANGDLMYSMSILKYRNEIWNNAEFIWFTEERFFDLFKYNNVETRIFENFMELMTNDFTMDQSKKHLFKSTSDIDIGFFVYPSWIPVEIRGKLNHLSECCRFAMGLMNHNIEWRPYLQYSNDEIEYVKQFFHSLPKNRYNILMETQYKSSQSSWNDVMTMNTMQICKREFGECNFIFASNLELPDFCNTNSDRIFTCKSFSIREISLLHDYCDLFIGVSSGISVAVSSWQNKPVPKIQFCSDYWASTFPITNARMELVTNCSQSNRRRLDTGEIIKLTRTECDAPSDFYSRLTLLINEIKNKK
ncbi:hypothetical protein BMW23_0560 [Bodo saltans virus]|uniref:Uncharacterized protein n=1 Tax=Bodo saltans virus TaxID=2024608 RepID=A0A2H4UUR8_9VIRU|nr:hypothetical protein QJ851_gp0544 [Bodo saltans virus]ATZ80607.1 hypothetical protein BMW23_0560 [Bodo saltans virus]